MWWRSIKDFRCLFVLWNQRNLHRICSFLIKQVCQSAVMRGFGWYRRVLNFYLFFVIFYVVSMAPPKMYETQTHQNNNLIFFNHNFFSQWRFFCAIRWPISKLGAETHIHIRCVNKFRMNAWKTFSHLPWWQYQTTIIIDVVARCKRDKCLPHVTQPVNVHFLLENTPERKRYILHRNKKELRLYKNKN